MRCQFGLFVVLLLSGCASNSSRQGPLSILSFTAARSADVVSCALQELGRLSYEVETVDEERGRYRARKRTSYAALRFLGQSTFDAMMMEFQEPTAAGRGTLHLMVYTIEEQYWGGQHDAGRPPTAASEAEARQILAACVPEEGQAG